MSYLGFKKLTHLGTGGLRIREYVIRIKTNFHMVFSKND